MIDVTRIDQQAERLRRARKMRGFATAKAAALRHGFNYNTYSQHERGQVGITRAARDYARAFKVSEAWLLTGEGAQDDMSPVSDGSEELQRTFARLAKAPPEVRQQVLSYADFVLDNFEKSRETATSPAA